MNQRKPGCYNRKEYVGYYYGVDMHLIKNTASRLCRSDYDIGKVGDCAGCTAPQDHEYFENNGLV